MASDPVGDIMVEIFHTSELFREVKVCRENPTKLLFYFAYRNVRIEANIAASLAQRLRALNCRRMAVSIEKSLNSPRLQKIAPEEKARRGC